MARGRRVARRKRRRQGQRFKWRSWRGVVLALAAIPGLYLFAAIVGGLIPVNRGWSEPDQGITIYIADNGIHADLVLPVRAAGLDWAPLVPQSDFASPLAGAKFIAFGAGERRVYLDTPTWADITPRTAWAGIAGGERVMHVEYVADPTWTAREIMITPSNIAACGPPSALRSPWTVAVDRKRSTTPATAPPTPSTMESEERTRSTPATSGSPPASASPASKPPCGARSSRDWCGDTGRPITARSATNRCRVRSLQVGPPRTPRRSPASRRRGPRR